MPYALADNDCHQEFVRLKMLLKVVRKAIELSVQDNIQMDR